LTSDVHVPEGVLQQLGELGLLAARHRNGPLHHAVVEALYGGERAGVDAGDDLGGVDERPGRVARVDALRAVADAEVAAGGEPGALLEDRDDQLLGRAGVRRRLEDDRGAGAQVAGERARGRLDEGQVRVALAQWRRHGDHGDVEAGAGAGLGRRPVAAALERRDQLRRRDVLHVGLARFEPFDPGLVDVVPDDVVPDLDRAHGERQADVPLPDDDELSTSTHTAQCDRSTAEGYSTAAVTTRPRRRMRARIHSASTPSRQVSFLPSSRVRAR
jgi:hypothetical protein